MPTRVTLAGLILVTTLTLVLATSAEAQIPNRLKRAAENAVLNEAERQTQRLLQEAIRCAIGDPVCARDAEESGEEVIYTDENGEVITGDDGVPITDREAAAEKAGVDISEPVEEPAARPGEGAWANYDFVPGEKVLFYEDYMDDKVGDFPRRMEFMGGNWDIIEWEGRRLLRNTGPRHSAVKIVLPSELPERFTIETEAYMPHGNWRLILATTVPAPRANFTTLEGNYFQIGVSHGTGVASLDGVESLNPTDEVSEGLVPIRIMVDGRYAKVYANEKRVANMPNAELTRTHELYFENIYAADEEQPILLGPIRVAAGGADLYDRLAEDGRVATHGILFDVNSATIRPESTPTLEEIGTMLQEHADLRIRIEGHTDSDGEDAYNQSLSEQRAEAVRQFMIDTYGIAADRLEAQGMGESSPVDTNDTPEGRQNNRRVELVQLP